MIHTLKLLKKWEKIIDEHVENVKNLKFVRKMWTGGINKFLCMIASFSAWSYLMID